MALPASGQASVEDAGFLAPPLPRPVERHLGVGPTGGGLAGHRARLNGRIREVNECPAYLERCEGPAVRPGQRSITAAMLVLCAAVGVAIAGVPHRSHEPAIRLSGEAGPVVTDPTPTTEPDQATTTSAAPSTTAPTTTTTTRPQKTTTSVRSKRATPSTSVVATTVAKSSPTTVRPTGLNPDGR